MLATATRPAKASKKALQARAELSNRELARRRLIDYSTYVWSKYNPAAHHRLIAEYLELVETYIRTKGATGVGRLMIFAPPRHGKSVQVSQLFPTWLLGRMPDTRIILASYNAELAAKNSRAAREILSDVKFRAVFGQLSSLDVPVEVSTDSRSVSAWDLASPHRGGVLAAGVGGGLSGHGANLLVIDDPFKNREEAESLNRRDLVYDWFRSSAYTRLEDGGAIVLMHTRWHQDDLAGRLLRAMATDANADQWVIINLPALAEGGGQLGLEFVEDQVKKKTRSEWLLDGLPPLEKDLLDRPPGAALWPQKYNEDDLAHIQANVGEYEWAALYQQMPYLRTGNFFKREWFTIVDTPPKPEDVIARVRYWDKAGSESGLGDFFVSVLMSLTKDDLYYVEHVARGRGTPGDRDKLILDTALFDMQRQGIKPVTWHERDPASSGLDSAQATNRFLAKHGITARFALSPSGNKEVKAGQWSTQLQGGNVRLVRAAWNQPYIEVHLAFPGGVTDDDVDASAGAHRRLNKPALKVASSYQG